MNEKVFPNYIAWENCNDQNGLDSVGGLSKREYFAAAALTGIMANPLNLDGKLDIEPARYAVTIADDLIAELEKIAIMESDD